MANQASARRFLTIGTIAVVVVVAAWLVMGPSQDEPGATAAVPLASSQRSSEAEPTPAPLSVARSVAPSVPPASVPPDYYIAESGRLSLDAASLAAHEVVTLGLGLDKQARGGDEASLAAVVVSASDGRRLELTATPVANSETDVTLQMESTWLEPGLYLVQLRTAEKTPFPVRRYVLEVSADSAPEGALKDAR
jgi:hypothetical protein